MTAERYTRRPQTRSSQAPSSYARRTYPSDDRYGRQRTDTAYNDTAYSDTAYNDTTYRARSQRYERMSDGYRARDVEAVRRRAVVARRRARVVPIVIGLLAVIAVVVGVSVAVGHKGGAAVVVDGSAAFSSAAASAGTTAGGSSSVAAQTTSQAGSATQTAQTATQSASAAATSGVTADPTDPRTDLALDPNRVTDWRYDRTDEKVVYLTFDDGPSYNTEKILDILDQYGIHATFFVTGQNPEYFDMIGEAYRRGNVIGLHTYSHDYADVYSSADSYYADLDKIGQLVKSYIGYVPCLIRFPGGSSNTISADYCSGIMTFLTTDVIAKGYQYWDWNMSCGDGADHTADDLVYYATNDYSDTENVMLMHDADGKDSTVEALPQIIEYYLGQGYTFKTLDRSAWVSHHSELNN